MLPTPTIDFQRTPVTLILTAVALAMELVCTLDPDPGDPRRHYLYNELQLGIWWQVWEGQLWRPFTTTLLHGSLLHAAFNIYWMITLGTAIEHRIGSPRYFVFIVVVAYFSTMGQFYFSPNGIVGLSGVVYGLFGLMWIGRKYVSEWYWICNDDTVRLMVGWFFFCFVLSYLGIMRVANIAHGAGLAMGWAIGGAAFDRTYQWPYRVAVGLMVATCIALLIAAPGNAQYDALQQQRARRQTGLIDVQELHRALQEAASETEIRLELAPVDKLDRHGGNHGVAAEEQATDPGAAEQVDGVDDGGSPDGV